MMANKAWAAASFFVALAACAQGATGVPDERWTQGWPEGERSCFVVKDGYGKETSRFCSVVVGVNGDSVRMNHWPGHAGEEHTTTRKSTNEYRWDKSSGLYGSSGSANLRFSPFEARGCLPVEVGRDCLKAASAPFEMQVASRQFPNWTGARLVEAYYGAEVESIRLPSSAEAVKVVRFTAKYRRNDGGEYIREYLTRPDSLYPVGERVWYKSEKAGVVEWATEVLEITSPRK